MVSGTEIFRLFGSILIDSTEADKSLSKTDSKTKDLQDSLGKVVTGAAKFAAGAAAAMSAAGAAVFKFADDVASTGDNIDKQSQKLGISAKAYQEWDAILGHCGASMDSLKGGMKTLTKAIADGSDDQVAAFQAIGLSMDQVKSMSTEEVFSAVITGLQNMEAGADRAQLATTLLGKAGQELGPLLNTSAEDTEAMRQAVNELGGVMSDDAVAASASFKDALQDLTTIGTGFKNSVGSMVLPYVTEAMTAITDGFRKDGIAGMATAAVEIMSDFAGKLVTEIPKLATSATEMITGLTGYLESHTDEILSTGGTLVVNLLTALIQNAPKLLAAGVKLIAALVQGIFAHIPDVAASAVKISEAMAQEMVQLAKRALSWGSDFVANIVKGIRDKISSVGDAAKEVAGAVAKFLHHTTPDEGPLADDDQWMPEMMQQFADGITENIPVLEDAAEQAADSAASTFSDMSSSITKLVSDGPVGALQNLYKSVKNQDWAGIGKFAAEAVYNGMSSDQKIRLGEIVTGWLTTLNDAYANGGWASVFQLGQSVANTLSATLSGQSGDILVSGTKWLQGMAQTVANATPVISSLSKLLGKGIFSGITAFFPQLFTAIGGLVGTIGTALSGVISAVIATLSAIPVSGLALAAIAAAGLAALLVVLAKIKSDLNGQGAQTDISTPDITTPSEAAQVPTIPTADPGGSTPSQTTVSADPGGSTPSPSAPAPSRPTTTPSGYDSDGYTPSAPSSGSASGSEDSTSSPAEEPTPGVTVIQYIYTNTDATASDLMREAIWEAERSALVGL